MRLATLALFPTILFALNASAQATDYPSFTIIGLVGGTEYLFQSDATGVAKAKPPGNDFASFHALSVDSNWSQLHFKYSCVYSKAPSTNVTLIETPTYEEGTSCPKDGDSGNSHFVRAIKITLEGVEAPNYIMSAQCWLGFFQQPGVHETLTAVGSGEWCGRQLGGADKEWISWIEVRLRKR
uniref:Uncharacterized protein n=1 Tax=viral metagenome TaxID=1070528 RepID=A0A6H1ZH92_9ZZZZ